MLLLLPIIRRVIVGTQFESNDFAKTTRRELFSYDDDLKEHYSQLYCNGWQ